MENNILIINPGSASKKYAFYSAEREILRAHFESEDDGFIVLWTGENLTNKEEITGDDYNKSVEFFIKKLISLDKIKKPEDIQKIVTRTVASGEYFLKHREINEEFIDKISESKDKSPLHLSVLIKELNDTNKILPNTKKFSISDSVFYSSRGEVTKYYGIPLSLAREHEIYRFGYHGISASSVMRKMGKENGKIPSRVIICHLGSGVSVIGVKDGLGYDSSMGFTPLEGPIMSTRSGSIDAGSLIFILKKKGFSPDELNSFLNKKCGLLGLSEKTDDMRQLINLESEGDKDAKRAIDTFVYRIIKEIGSMFVTIGGVDKLIFTGTMGERSNIVRERICDELGSLGIFLDKEKNNETIDKNGVISKKDSSADIIVLKTDEMEEMFELSKDIK